MTKQNGQIIKSVCLDETTEAIRAERIPANFSRWVREQLKELENEKREYHVNVIGVGFLRFCNPFHAKGLCRMCWPDGPPIRQDWLEYVRLSSHAREPSAPLPQPKPARIKTESVSAEKTGEKSKRNALRVLSLAGWLLYLATTL